MAPGKRPLSQTGRRRLDCDRPKTCRIPVLVFRCCNQRRADAQYPGQSDAGCLASGDGDPVSPPVPAAGAGDLSGQRFPDPAAATGRLRFSAAAAARQAFYPGVDRADDGHCHLRPAQIGAARHASRQGADADLHLFTHRHGDHQYRAGALGRRAASARASGDRRDRPDADPDPDLHSLRAGPSVSGRSRLAAHGAGGADVGRLCLQLPGAARNPALAAAQHLDLRIFPA